MKEKVVAIIPARGNSKRLPRKNIRTVFGKPLIAWSIEACRQSRYIDDIYVSTEDAEIAAIARELGAQVIERPAELAEDHVWTQDVLRHAVSTLESRNVDFNIVVRIQANSPQVQGSKIDEAIEKLLAHNRWEIFSIDQNGLEDAAIHILRKKCVVQQALSVYKGIVTTDYIDVHKEGDLQTIEHSVLDDLHAQSTQFLDALEQEYINRTWRRFVPPLARRHKFSLWQWQVRIPLRTRWNAVLDYSEELRQLCSSTDCHQKAAEMRVLDLGSGFGMYWPIMRQYGFKKFVGIDLFDMRKPEFYLDAARRYVKEFCPDCETMVIMDDARNLHRHGLPYEKFDVILNIASVATKLGSTGIPRPIFDNIMDRFAAPGAIGIHLEKAH